MIKRNLKKGRLSEIAGTSTLSQTDWEAARSQLGASEAMTSTKLHKSRD